MNHYRSLSHTAWDCKYHLIQKIKSLENAYRKGVSMVLPLQSYRHKKHGIVGQFHMSSYPSIRNLPSISLTILIFLIHIYGRLADFYPRFNISRQKKQD